MTKRYRLTREQRMLRDGMLELAAKEGLKVETIEIKMRPYKDIANFLRMLKRAEYNISKSKPIIYGYSPAQFQPAY